MPTIADWIARATRRLAGVTETPRLDAELILAHELGISRAAMLGRLRDPLPSERAGESLLSRREQGEPLAYVFGRWEFYSMEFEVEPPALVPRPETEHLVEAVLEFVGPRPATVLDLCTGTGCVAVAVAANAPACRVVAADVNARYVALAQRNSARHGLSDRVECAESDLFSGVKHPETFDAVCANPPYVEATAWDTLSRTIRDFEDPRALLAGADGLDVVRAIVAQAPGRLCPGGLLALEIGLGQSAAVSALLDRAGYQNIAFRRDLSGIDRVVTASPPRGIARVKEKAGAVRQYPSEDL